MQPPKGVCPHWSSATGVSDTAPDVARIFADAYLSPPECARTRNAVPPLDAAQGSMAEETYGEERARRLEALLRDLAARIVEIDARGELLKQAGELMRLIGDVRTELFHYEVRATYDTPEVAENRRIVGEAKDNKDESWQKTEWTPDEDDEPTW